MAPAYRIAGFVLLLILVISYRSQAQESTPSNGPADLPLNPSQSHLEALQTSRRKVAFRVRSDFYSRYMWHGVPFSNGAVWQPSAVVEYYGVGMSVWTNFVLNDEPNQGEFNEVDFTLYYQRNVKRWRLQASLIGAVFFNDDPNSLNRGPNSLGMVFQVNRPVGPISLFTNLDIGFLNPAGTIFWDFGLSYQRPLPLRFGLETSALFGLGDGRFNKEYFADVGTQANLFEFSLAFPWTPIKGLSFTSRMTVTTLLATSIRQAAAQPTIVWGGLSVAYAF